MAKLRQSNQETNRCCRALAGFTTICLVFACAAGHASAQSSQPQSSKAKSFEALAAAATAAKQNVRLSTAEDVARRKQAVITSLQQVDWYLQTSGPLVYADWREYLRWEELQQQIQAENPDLATLDEIRQLMLANEPGLEHNSFVSARRDLLGYMNELLLASQGEDFRAYYEDRLDKLAAALKTYGEKPSESDAAMIAGVLGMLERFDQSPELVADLRAKFSLPNLRVFLTPALITAAMENQVAEPSQSRDVILGTSTRSQIYTTGSLRMTTLPSAKGARLAVQFAGQASAQTVGVNGPATICSNSWAQLGGTLTFKVTEEGLIEENASASASTRTQITGVSAKLKLVERIASRRVAQQKSLAERIASAKAENKLLENLQDRGAELVSDANSRLFERVRAPLIRKDALPRDFDLSSGYNGLLAKITYATRFQIAAHDRPPVPLREDIDAGVLVHESFAGNLSSSLLGGVTITRQQMADLVRHYELKMPEDLESEEAEDWSFTFSLSQPISTEFGDGTVKLTIRGDRFSRSGREFNRNVVASATYKIESSIQGVLLKRDGPVEVDLGRGGINVTIKTFLENRFEQALPKEVEFGKFHLNGELSRMGELQLRQFIFQPQWATISINRSAK